MTQRLRGSTAATAVGALAVAGVLVVALAGHRDDFAAGAPRGAALGPARRDPTAARRAPLPLRGLAHVRLPRPAGGSRAGGCSTQAASATSGA